MSICTACPRHTQSGVALSRTPAKACATVAARTAARSPGRCSNSVCTMPRRSAQASHTVPTGFSAEPPVGPATPVTATAMSARECARATC